MTPAPPPPSRRTRRVRALRLVLPLAALGLLSALFLLPAFQGDEPSQPIPWADPGPGVTPAEGAALTAPAFATVTPDGATLRFRADRATPGADGRAESLRLDWQGADGLTAVLTAPEGRAEDAAVRLGGGVDLTLSSGWTLAAPQIAAATDRSALTATGGIVATAPFGRLSAGAAALARDPAEGTHRLDFTGGVRLLYRPPVQGPGD